MEETDSGTGHSSVPLQAQPDIEDYPAEPDIVDPQNDNNDDFEETDSGAGPSSAPLQSQQNNFSGAEDHVEDRVEA